MLSPRTRRIVLTTHIVASVGLLGDVAVYLAVATRAATTSDPALQSACYELLTMFGFVFGIPLSLASLATGVTLGLGSKWGVLRYPWVTTKLALNVSVILVGALVLGPTADAMRTGDARRRRAADRGRRLRRRGAHAGDDAVGVQAWPCTRPRAPLALASSVSGPSPPEETAIPAVTETCSSSPPIR